MPRYNNQTADTVARRLAQRMAQQSVPPNMGDPYGDLSAKDDTATYFGTRPRINPTQILLDDYRNKMYRDSSWLPQAVGSVAIVPEELTDRSRFAGGYRLPPGYSYSDKPTPPFTPIGGVPVPTVGIIVSPPAPSSPGSPAPWRRGGIRPDLEGVQPRIIIPPTR